MKATFKEQAALDAQRLNQSRSKGGQAVARRNGLNKLFGFHGGTRRTTRFDQLQKPRDP